MTSNFGARECVRHVERLPDASVSPGILRVAVRRDAVEASRRDRVQRCEERHVDAALVQPGCDQPRDAFPRP
jgi:hypothetical protein